MVRNLRIGTTRDHRNHRMTTQVLSPLNLLKVAMILPSSEMDGERKFSARQVEAVEAHVSWFLKELVV